MEAERIKLLTQIRDSRALIVSVWEFKLTKLGELKGVGGTSPFEIGTCTVSLEEARINLAEAELKLMEFKLKPARDVPC